MAKKRPAGKPKATQLLSTVTITHPSEDANVQQWFSAYGGFTPSTLYLRTQLRSTSSADPTAGTAVSALIDDPNFAQKTSDSYITGFYKSASNPMNPPPTGACYVHLWGYDSSTDPIGDYSSHVAISITIVPLQ